MSICKCLNLPFSHIACVAEFGAFSLPLLWDGKTLRLTRCPLPVHRASERHSWKDLRVELARRPAPAVKASVTLSRKLPTSGQRLPAALPFCPVLGALTQVKKSKPHHQDMSCRMLQLDRLDGE